MRLSWSVYKITPTVLIGLTGPLASVALAAIRNRKTPAGTPALLEDVDILQAQE